MREKKTESPHLPSTEVAVEEFQAALLVILLLVPSSLCRECWTAVLKILNYSSNRVAFSDNDGKAAAHQFKELFLPFRCFCTRKDIQVNEVVIEDTDIRFLYHVLYTGGNNIPGIYTDIPGSVTKGAPHFCNEI